MAGLNTPYDSASRVRYAVTEWHCIECDAALFEAADVVLTLSRPVGQWVQAALSG